MARLVTADFEGGTVSPLSAAGSAGSVIAAAARRGSFGWRSAQNAASLVASTTTVVALGQWGFARIEFLMSGLPASSTTILHFRNGTTQIAALQIVAGTGVLRLIAGTATVVVTGPALVAGQWYTAELGLRVNGAGVNDDIAIRLDGSLLGSSNIAVTDGQINGTRCGWTTTPGATSNCNIDIDSVAVNDDTGAAPDNTWPGVIGGVDYRASSFFAAAA